MGSFGVGIYFHHTHHTHQTNPFESVSDLSRTSGHRHRRRPPEKGGVRWPDEEGGEFGDLASDQPKTFRGKVAKIVKIMIPHVGLTLLLLSYIAGGAAIFQWLETETEVYKRQKKIRNELWSHLENLSYTHEYDERFSASEQLWKSNLDDIKTRWTFQAAALYALTVITTTGYDHITPLTGPGQLFTVFFGLFGIPLMFITAADIGKFLSEVVTALYGRFVSLLNLIRRRILVPFCRLFCPTPSASSTTSTEVSSPNNNNNNNNNGNAVNNKRGMIAPNGDVIQKDQRDPLNQMVVEDLNRVQLPVIAYFCLILGYCAIGGFIFTQWEDGPIWTFAHGFFFSFNTITTIGLGNVRVVNLLYMFLIVCYVIVGLAVITMCVDLASSQLKVFFTRLHYFGRKFRGARALINMSDDIKEAMKIIQALKRTRSERGGAGGRGITLEDIKQFLEIEQKYQEQPFVPGEINALRWVDDEDLSSCTTTQRSASVSLKHVSSDPNIHYY